jgi:hypothetical protein
MLMLKLNIYVEGNLTMLKEKILSIPLHCSNIHVFPGNKEHMACSHGPLGDRTKAWLKPDSKVRIYFDFHKHL